MAAVPHVSSWDGHQAAWPRPLLHTPAPASADATDERKCREREGDATVLLCLSSCRVCCKITVTLPTAASLHLQIHIINRD